MSGPASGAVVINEIHHSPDVKQEPVEFVELFNTGPQAEDLSGWAFDAGVDFVFPQGIRMDPGQFLVIAGDPAAVSAKFGIRDVLGPWTGRLAGEGERIRLRDAAGRVQDQVEYRLGFPWPTVGDPPGYSMELIHPALDNDLGGHWRSSVVGGAQASTRLLQPSGARWRLRKGTSAPSNPATAWRQPDFDASAWTEGAAPVGYDPDVAFGTRLDDMRGAYTQFFLRGEFSLAGADAITGLRLEVLYDDGFILWINGYRVFSAGMPSGELLWNGVSSGEARESNSYDRLEASVPPGVLREGRNVIAVQVANVSRDASSDAFFDARLFGIVGPSGRGPTPGRTNAVFALNAPPAVRQVSHEPESPKTGDRVVIRARITDPDGVDSVRLDYQIVAPGDYIERDDPRFEAGWASIPMLPEAGDASRFAAELPEAAVKHRQLVRYRIVASDRTGLSGRSPHADDPQPNFALFVYDGVPAWSGALRPGAAGDPGTLFTVDAAEMNRLPVYHLIARKQAVEDCTWYDRSHGDEYFWTGTLVYDGRVYDHIRFRPRGGVWRYAMGKNMWKFDFNRGHDFVARDNWGRRYRTPWTKLNLGASIQQGDTLHRGEQGMFESVGFRMFQMLGVPASHTTFVQFRIVDEPLETAPNSQYAGDFWGVYLAIEQLNGRFLDEHGLPDGNFYKMENGFGEPNNLGPDGPVDSSDLSAFINAYTPASQAQLPDDWWRANLNLETYYSYQVGVQAIHHYDIADGKNYFYYRHPADHRWTVIPWDLDLTWANNMYRSGQTGGDEPFKSRVLSNFGANPRRPALVREFRNRAREVRDLLWNTDEAFRLIDEYALRLRGMAPSSLLDADRAQWDYNPLMNNASVVLPDKAGQGRFYRFPAGLGVTRTFAGAPQLMKNYVGYRATNATFSLDVLSAERDLPATPRMSYLGADGFPLNRLRFRCDPYQGAAPFRSVKWRLAEVSRTGHPGWDPATPMAYEIQPVWESAELTVPTEEIQLPPPSVIAGRLYRVRVRHTDAEGRAGHWSAPVEFTAGEPSGAAEIARDLRLTEIMYNPPPEGFEFLELHNVNPVDSLALDDAAFVEGIAYTFPSNSIVPPGGYVLLVHTTNTAAFREWHGLEPNHPLYGPFDGSLDNGGETLVLRSASGGSEVLRITYSDDPPWPVEADGDGFSLVPRWGGPEELSDAGHWRASFEPKGSPGRADPEPVPQILGYTVTASGLEIRFTAAPSVTWAAEVGALDGPWTLLGTYSGPATVVLPFSEADPVRLVRGVRESRIPSAF
ncbi:MAG: lamin tail domain-containing protein [Verrucomicrobiae bacterium]|nr:lamin tail domain-containing protein [Verrucomicrobiae bacterium]